MDVNDIVESIKDNDWIFKGATRLDIILALTRYAGELSEYQALISEELEERFQEEAYEKAKQDFDRRLKQALELK